jgi:hypothetical protein
MYLCACGIYFSSVCMIFLLIDFGTVPSVVFFVFHFIIIELDFRFSVFNATFDNISTISWRLVLVVEEARVPGENH